MSETILLISRLAAAIVEEAGDMAPESITEETMLSRDLGFGSIDYVRLVVEVERELNRKMGFHDLLMPAGTYVSDLSVGAFAAFVDTRMTGDGPVATSDAPPMSSASADESTTRSKENDARVTTERLNELRSRMVPPHYLKNLPLPAQRRRRALFILTPPRCGSTLLQLMLSAHPEIFAPPELYILGYASMGQRETILGKPASRVLLTGAVQAVMQASGQSREQAESFVAEMARQDRPAVEFYDVIQEWIGDRLLVDKSPLYTSHVDIMRRAENEFDDPLYIHLLRHPGGMVKSFTDTRIGEMIPFAQDISCPPALLAEMIWQVSNVNIVTFLKDVPQERCCKLQFEDVVSQPEACVRQLCSFLEVPYVESMTDPYSSTTGYNAAKEVGYFSGDLKVHLYQGIRAEAADRWRQHFKEERLSDPTLALYRRLADECKSDSRTNE